MSVSEHDLKYRQAVAQFGPALERLAAGYEADPDKRRDLAQEIHFALWRSFTLFEAACSLRTWVYRVAHNTATKHVVKEQRVTARRWIDLDEDLQSDMPGPEEAADRRQGLARLMRLIHQLKPPDRQIILLFLEGLEGAAIAEIMGMNAPAVGTRIHRLKHYLAQQFNSVSRRPVMKGPESSAAPEPDFQALWSTQNHEVNEMNEIQLNKRLDAFNRGRFIRKAIAIFAAVITVKIFIFSLFISRDWILQTGLCLLAAWVCFVAITLRSPSGRHKSIDACCDFFQSLLADERRYLAGGTIWGPLTAFPIAALVFWRLMVLLPSEYQGYGWIAGGVCFAGGLVKVLFFRWHMHRLDGQIAALGTHQ